MGRAQCRALLRADAVFVRVARCARLLPHFTPQNAATERARLVRSLERGRPEEPRWTYAEPFRSNGAREAMERAGRALGSGPLSRLYRRRLRQLRFQLELLEGIGVRDRVLPASRRVFGSATPRIRALARSWLRGPPTSEARDVPGLGSRGVPSVANALRAEMFEYGTLWPVRVEPRLAASAAVVAREILLGGTRFYSQEEVRRLAAHEVGVHLVSHENAREQPFAIFAVGTAGATRDQEGLALWAEVGRGAFTAYRRRILAARTLAVACLEEGLDFVDAARMLVRDHGLSEEDAVYACERAYRGGGLTKDAVYLAGYLQVGRALLEGRLDLVALSVGQVSLGDARLVRDLLDQGVLPRPRRRSRDLEALRRDLRRCRFDAISDLTPGVIPSSPPGA